MKKILGMVLVALFALMPFGAQVMAESDVEGTQRFESSAFFIGENVPNNATVNGIGLILNDSVSATGEYEYGVMAGNAVSVAGKVAKDAFIAGNVIDIPKQAEIGRDLYIAGSSVTIATDIPGNVYVYANTVIIKNATISGNLITLAKRVSFENATIAGEFKHDYETEIAGSYTVTNTVVYAHSEAVAMRYNPGNVITNHLLSLAGYLVIAILVVIFGKKMFEKLDKDTASYKGIDIAATTLKGLLSIIVIPVAVAMLALTVVGIPAALLVVLFYIVLVCLSSILVANFVGKRILKKQQTLFCVTLGLVIFTVIELVPYIGVLVSFIITLFGLGLFINLLFAKK